MANAKRHDSKRKSDLMCSIVLRLVTFWHSRGNFLQVFCLASSFFVRTDVGKMTMNTEDCDDVNVDRKQLFPQ